MFHMDTSKETSADTSVLSAAVIGYGNIAPVHLASLRRLPGVRIAAICDDAPSRQAAAKADHPDVAVYADYKRMLSTEKPSVVHICTPHYLHVPMAIECLKSGAHVVLEKPCAMNLADGKALEKVWRSSGLQVGVCFQNRYRPAVREAKRLLESGAYGKTLGIRGTVAWRRDAAYYASGTAWRGKWASEGGGVLINQAIHTLDLIQWLGGGVVRSRATGANLSLPESIEVEDSAVVVMDFASGGRGILFATNANVEDSPIEVDILCEKARLRISDALYLALRSSSGADSPLALHVSDEDDEEQDAPGKGEADNAADSAAGGSAANRSSGRDSASPVPAKAYWGIRHYNLISDFYECVREKKAFAIDPAAGLKTVEILDTIYGDPKRGFGRPAKGK
jgi:predicted dehydrogenase